MQEHKQDVISQRRALYLRLTSVGMSGVGVAFGLLLTWLAGWQLGALLFVYAALSLTIPVMMNRGVPLLLVSHFFMFIFLAAMSGVLWQTGGLNSPAVYALAIGAPMGVLILNVQGSIAWTGIILFQLVLAGYIRFQGLEVVQLLSKTANENITSVTIVSVVLVLYVLLLQYQSALAEQVKAVAMSKSQLEDARAEAICAHADFEKAALVATGDGHSGGLVGRMREESTTGSASLIVARDQIDQMFSELSEVEPRVEQLKTRSDQIVHHLATLERVSRKLDLMAINAALEAARAGEHGATFGPLAQDMRRLAESAVVEIESIHEGIRRVSDESEAVGEVATRSAESAKESRERIADLDKTFSTVLGLFEQSTSAAQQARSLGRRQLDSIVLLLKDADEASDGRAS